MRTFIQLLRYSRKISIFLFFLPSIFFAQNRTLDSLFKLPPSFIRDTTICRELTNTLAKIETIEKFIPVNDQFIEVCKDGLKRSEKEIDHWNYYVEQWTKRVRNIAFIYIDAGQLKEAIASYKKLLEVEKKFKEVSPPLKRASKEMSATFNNIGYFQYQAGDPTSSIKSYQQSLKCIADYRSVDPAAADEEKAMILNNLGSVLQNVGDIANSLELQGQSLSLRLSLNKNYHSNKTEISLAQSYNNLGKLYDELYHPDKAMDFYQKSLAILEKTNDQMGMSVIYNNIGGIYSGKKDLPKAIEYYEKSIKMKMILGDNPGLSQTYNNLASIYKVSGDLAKALETFLLAVDYAKKSSSSEQLCYAYCDLGMLYKHMGKINEAEVMGEKAFKIAKSIGLPNLIVHTTKLLYDVYTLKGKFKDAIFMCELNMKMTDSLTSGKNRKAIVQQEYKYAYEKKQLADSVRTNEENKIFQAQIRSDKMQKNGLLIGISVLILFSIFMYNRFRVINVQKKIIEQQSSLVQEQKQIAEAKQHEVLSSIRYAKKIQTALLPNEKKLTSILKNKKSAG